MTKNGQDVIYEGWLTKSPPVYRIWRARWRKRWFSLQYSGELPGQVLLMYYTDRNRRKLKGIIDMDHCEQVDTGFKYEHTKYKFDHMFDIRTPTRIYYLAAESEEEMKAWVNCICKICGLKATVDDDDFLVSVPAGVPPPATYAFTDEKKKVKEVIIDSPPVTPVSTGPYIPISECITGRSPTQGVKDFRTLVDLNTKNSFYRTTITRDISNSTYDSNSHIYLNETESDPRFYDFPRSLGKPTPTQRKQKPSELYANIGTEKGSPLQSPTDSESVFTDEDWPLSASSNDTTPKMPKGGTTDEGGKKLTLDGHRTLDPPPRPPKSVNVAYFHSLQRDPKSKETVCQKNEEEGQAKTVTSDEMYDFPRSHQIDSAEVLPQRHCYNNAAPGKVEGEIFRYDISPRAHSTTAHVFQFDISDEEKQHSPLAFSQPNGSPLPHMQLKPPPEINRKLKPTRKLSDSISIASSVEPSSPRLAPSVDRTRKPIVTGKGNLMQKPYESDFDYNRRFRAIPSPILNSLYGNHKICSFHDDAVKKLDQDDYKKIQYLDLDLGDSSFSTSVKVEPLRSPGAITVYKHVDFLKTEAFNITKHNLEKERIGKDPVTTYKK